MALNASMLRRMHRFERAPGRARPNRHRRAAGGAGSRRKEQGELRIYQHSNLLYWWPIWAYGFVCAGLDLRAGRSA